MTDDEDAPSRKVHWAGRQWCVTDYGLETNDPHGYDIEAGNLGKLSDGKGEPLAEHLCHVGTKRWVDPEDLIAAFAVALAIHADRFSALAPGAFLNAAAYVRAARYRNSRNRSKPGEDEGFPSIEELLVPDMRDDGSTFDIVAEPTPNSSVLRDEPAA